MLVGDWKIWIKKTSFLEVTALESSLEEQEMLIQAIQREPMLLKFITNKHKTQKICEKAVEMKRWILRFVPDHLKTQEMYNKARQKEPWWMSLITSIPRKSV